MGFTHIGSGTLSPNVEWPYYLVVGQTDVHAQFIMANPLTPGDANIFTDPRQNVGSGMLTTRSNGKELNPDGSVTYWITVRNDSKIWGFPGIDPIKFDFEGGGLT